MPRWPSGTIAERFWIRVDRDGPIPAHVPDLGPCWPWKGRTNAWYGDFRDGSGGRRMHTHRWAWVLTFGEVPGGLCVLHECDLRPCCNPWHLWLGTLADNNRDMFAKGRDRPGSMVGENNPMSKLTNLQREEIRRSKTPTKALAQKYGVRMATIISVRGRVPCDTEYGRRRGELYPNPRRQLTRDEAREIRYARCELGVPLRDLSARYGVAVATVWQIAAGRIYKEA